MMKKVVSIVLILTMICMMNVPAIAASVSDLQDQKSEAEDKLCGVNCTILSCLLLRYEVSGG